MGNAMSEAKEAADYVTSFAYIENITLFTKKIFHS